MIDESYAGTKHRDCCITEIELIGLTENTFTARTMSEWGGSVLALQRELNSGRSLRNGSVGYEVLGLQVLLRDAFGISFGDADGGFGEQTESAVNRLADQMRVSLGGSAEYMTYGVVDRAYLNNMLAYGALLDAEPDSSYDSFYADPDAGVYDDPDAGTNDGTTAME